MWCNEECCIVWSCIVLYCIALQCTVFVFVCVFVVVFRFVLCCMVLVLGYVIQYCGVTSGTTYQYDGQFFHHASYDKLPGGICHFVRDFVMLMSWFQFGRGPTKLWLLLVWTYVGFLLLIPTISLIEMIQQT